MQLVVAVVVALIMSIEASIVVVAIYVVPRVLVGWRCIHMLRECKSSDMGMSLRMWFKNLYRLLANINTDHPFQFITTMSKRGHHCQIHHVAGMYTQGRVTCFQLPHRPSSGSVVPQRRQQRAVHWVVDLDFIDIDNMALVPVVPGNMPVTCSDLPTIGDADKIYVVIFVIAAEELGVEDGICVIEIRGRLDHGPFLDHGNVAEPEIHVDKLDETVGAVGDVPVEHVRGRSIPERVILGPAEIFLG